MDLINRGSSQQQEESAYNKLFAEVKRLGSLHLENIKLLATEKLTLLLGRIAMVAVTFTVSATALIFLSMAVADFLLRGLEPCWTYLIIGGFYVMIVVLTCVFRRRLIIDPIARYISRMILDPPAEKEAAGTSVAATKPASSPK